MKLPVTLLCSLLSIATASAQATYRFGVRAGGNYATTTEKSATFTSYGNATAAYHKSPLFAGQIGVVLEARWNKLAFQPALLFSQKGTLIDADLMSIDPATGYFQRRVGQTTARYNWLELPLNLVYDLPGQLGLHVFAGPYVAVGVGGKAISEVYNSTNDPNNPAQIPYTKFGDKIEYDLSDATLAITAFSIRGFYSRRVDAGFNAGVGYRRGPVQVQAGYGLGLVNLYYDKAADRYNSSSGYNRVAQLTATYFFN
ncbi:outer membrane beta-barrel protein [Hymenobacter convexus]|uniref:outer membrane beta-barrel protein n=1 Tax=Hymenobacter sp. CA1UV-4 TaxID=3063782 RepID=UPI0027132ADB|nr:outer membrane beta-barrel protein [Hymenobacter sp. CA1UV-4]MDO7850263.1 outer membrane beta-barrel protein [Hymenobacter sp. CA1UV-4]